MEKHILCIAGTRPEIIKMAPVMKALRSTPWAKTTFASSGQHRELAANAFSSFKLKPDLDLGIMTENQTLSSLTGRLFATLEPSLKKIKPDLVIAQGDTTTVMVVATCCFYLGIPFAHIEAGLRTGNYRDPFPEEFNRVVVSRLAALHFVPTQNALQSLLAEGIAKETAILTGNTVIDALLDVKKSSISGTDSSRKLILLTAHRRENFGPPLERVFQAVRDILEANEDTELLYPVHPNPNVADMAKNFFGNSHRATLCAPLGYVDFVGAMQRAHIIVSDSGGVQEEAPALCKPVLIIRNETERPEAIAAGAARLVGTEYTSVRTNIEALLHNERQYQTMTRGASPYGDGKASNRIVDAIEVFLGIKKNRALKEFKIKI